MSLMQTPPPVKLVVSLLFRGSSVPEETEELKSALALLEGEYGSIDIQSPIWPFRYTSYYEPEMGKDLWRRLCSFAPLVPRERLVEIKHFCQQLERRFMDETGCRRVNVDPGCLSPENFILATGKNFTHRIYLGQGVFADLTLIYQHKRFQSLPWTYPDYASAEIQSCLTDMRRRLLTASKPYDDAAD